MGEPAVWIVVLTGLAAGVFAGVWLARRVRLTQTVDRDAESRRIRNEAELERQPMLREAEIQAREQALAVRLEAETTFRAKEAELAQKETALAARKVRTDEEARQLDDLRETLKQRTIQLNEREQEGRALVSELQSIENERRAELERVAAQSSADVQKVLVEAEIEEARASAAQTLRQLTETAVGSTQTRAAKRIMGISVGRFVGHDLAERPQYVIALSDLRPGQVAPAEEDLRAIEAVVPGVQLSYLDGQTAIRIEGLDGVAREIARRCVTRMLKRSISSPPAVTRLARSLAVDVEREAQDLGRKAFSALAIDRAHPELVKLLGRLHFRTSYAQNQWKHSVEAGFLCGMMAAELGLDVRLARRAALLHDIGKALTHEVDGSHALIGADHARRFNEADVVVNAIAAHHTDEPFGSVYAYLVAAADAMSGGRPGARRQSEDNHMAKLEEIERISRGFGGVDEAFAVQGGREVRIYVDENRVDDQGAVRLSAQIAESISREMTFPGQIKVTVIREFLAEEVAG
jgi:ribonuclease Y